MPREPAPKDEQIVREAADEATPNAHGAAMAIWSDEGEDEFDAFQTAM